MGIGLIGLALSLDVSTCRIGPVAVQRRDDLKRSVGALLPFEINFGARRQGKQQEGLIIKGQTRIGDLAGRRKAGPNRAVGSEKPRLEKRQALHSCGMGTRSLTQPMRQREDIDLSTNNPGATKRRNGVSVEGNGFVEATVGMIDTDV